MIRAEASAADKYSALDLASGRFEERLRRAHDKSKVVKGGSNHRRTSEVKEEGAAINAAVEAEDELTDTYQADSDEVFSSGPVVVRDKTHPAAPMSIEQAVTEMELVGTTSSSSKRSNPVRPLWCTDVAATTTASSASSHQKPSTRSRSISRL